MFVFMQVFFSKYEDPSSKQDQRAERQEGASRSVKTIRKDERGARCSKAKMTEKRRSYAVCFCHCHALTVQVCE